jgi:hypothetical protein
MAAVTIKLVQITDALNNPIRYRKNELTIEKKIVKSMISERVKTKFV